jgi:two-component system sensor histidine kinase/response regulator
MFLLQTAPMSAPANRSQPGACLRFDGAVPAALAAEIGWPDVDMILDVFLAETASRLAKLRQNAEAGDAAAFGRQIHAMKSAAGALGFMALADLGQNFLAEAAQSDPARLCGVSIMIDAVFSSTCLDAQAWRRDRQSTAAGASGNPSPQAD